MNKNRHFIWIFIYILEIIYFLTLFVIQTTEGRKNLASIH